MIVWPTSPEWATPIVRTLEFDTTITRGDDGTEQRWPGSPGRESFTLPYSELARDERDTLLNAIDAAMGSADQTISLDFEGATYDGLYLDADESQFVESEPMRWSGSVKLCQVMRPPNTDEPSADFPVLDTGAVVQLPFGHGHQWETAVAQAMGGRTARALRSGVVREWRVGGTALTDAEAQAIWDLFDQAQGMWRSFGFTDPDSGTVYASCRFAEDKLEWRILGAGVNSLQSTVVTIL